MKKANISKRVWDVDATKNATNAQLKMILGYFAEQLDDRIQADLVADLMVRYADVSKQLEQQNHQLAKAYAGIREAQQIAMLGSWSMDLADGRLVWSDTLYSVLGIDRVAEPDWEAFYQRVCPEDLALVRGRVEDLLAGKTPLDHRCRLLMEKGRIKWVHMRYVMLSGSGKPSVSVSGTVQDITEAKLGEEKLQEYSDHLEELVQKQVREISTSQIATIFALVKLAESRDDDTGVHIERTSGYCRLIAQKLMDRPEYADIVNDDYIENIALASPLHDVGKVGIPDAILLKPGRLTPEEMEIMKTHANIGYETLASVQKQYLRNAFLKMGMEIARSHHEKWDGSGYPQRLSGEDIPLSARIMAVADVYDALRSKRVYKPGCPHAEAMEIVKRGSGSHFDPALVEIFVVHQEAFREIFDKSQE
jgi:putative two-component system response regulator